MKVAALITLSALVAATASAAPADPQASAPVFKIPNNGQGEIIPDQYIVRFKNDADHATLTSSFKKTIERENAQEGNTLKSELHHEFDALPEFKGVAGKFSKSLIEKLKKHDKVAEVIPDKKVYALGTQTSPPSWGIGRISRKSGIGAYVFPDTAGANVDVYVIDTGVYAAHRDFGGRARMAWKANSSWPSNDDNGHGTHCAGTIGGATYGVAKRANIFGVKVLGGDGSGSNSGVIAGINFVAQQAKNKGRTIIASMSLGGGYDSATNSAVRSLYYAGAVVAVAAGNESQNACNVSPASESTAITVGATTRYDRFESSYSNYGSCVDILAPGTDITSTWNNGGSNTISGTSMATPHVAGAAALWLGVNTAQTNQQVRDGLLGWASQGIISGVPSGTPNRFLYTGDGQ